MNATVLKYCDVCKRETKRCQYYPKGRSRQHDQCLECDARDPRQASLESTDARYCITCDRNHRLVGS
jgi:hypothetical protein